MIASFARFAPEDCALLIKDHPLDNGLTPYAAFIESMAEALGCKDRVVFVADGNINALVAKARGVVLINSTVGLTALLAGRPVFCLGYAVYALKGLAQNAFKYSLDLFWQRPGRPDAAVLRAFCRVLQHEALIAGNFYTPDGMSRALADTVRRFVRCSHRPQEACAHG